MAQATPIAPPLIRCLNVTQRYAGRGAVISDCSLTVAQGEILALVGPNGCGKSVLLRLLAGLQAPTSGDVIVEGINLAHTPVGIAAFTGFLAQSPDAPAYLAVYDLLVSIGQLRGMPAREARAAARDLLDRSGLGNVARRALRDLPDGQARLARFCAALMGYPRVLLLDEPTEGMDLRQRKWVWEILGQLHQKTGLTTVLTTHHILEAEQCAHRVAFLKAGQIVAMGSPAMLKAQYGGGPRMDVKLNPGAKLGTAARARLQTLGRLVERDAEAFVLYPNPEVIGPLARSGTAATAIAQKVKARAAGQLGIPAIPATGNDSWLLDRPTIPGSLGRSVEEIFAIIGPQQIAEFWFAPPTLEDVFLKLEGEPSHA